MIELIKDIEDRFNGLEHIVLSIHNNIDLLEYISYNLHKERFNLFNNLSLYYIWGLLMGEVLLDFYKLTHNDEKHSFQKILNISKRHNIKIAYQYIQEKIDKLIASYNKTNFDTVRSKYLAHLDSDLSIMKIDLSTLSKYKKEVFDLYEVLTSEFNRKKVEFQSEIKEALAEIFDVIDEYDEISCFLLANAMKGKSSVELSQIQEIIRKRATNSK